MKIAITGATGEIGYRLYKLGYTPLSLDLTNLPSIKKELEEVRPDIIVHCAGISSVEECQKDLDFAIAVNVRGTHNLCEEASDIGAKVVLLSTDYIFDGQEGNYKEDSEWNPINNYGLSKVGAEAVIRVHEGKVIRLSRCFSAESKDIHGYIRNAIVRPDLLTIPDFIFRSYCHTDLIVKGVHYYLKSFEDMPNTLNIAGAYSLSYFDFISLLCEKLEIPRKVLPRQEDYSHLAPRPHRGGLDVSLATSLGVPIFNIYESIERLRDEMKNA